MSNNAPDYENDLVFPPSMPRCDIDELKEKVKIAEEALEFVVKTIPSNKWISEKDLENCYETARETLAKIRGN